MIGHGFLSFYCKSNQPLLAGKLQVFTASHALEALLCYQATRHRLPLTLPVTQQISLNKHFSVSFLLLVDFWSAEMVVLDNFATFLVVQGKRICQLLHLPSSEVLSGFIFVHPQTLYGTR